MKTYKTWSFQWIGGGYNVVALTNREVVMLVYRVSPESVVQGGKQLAFLVHNAKRIPLYGLMVFHTA